MRDRCKALATQSFWTLVVVLAMLGLVLVQAEAQQRPPRRVRGQVRDQGGVPLKKARPDAADPLAKAGGAAGGLAPGTYHFNFRLHSFDGTPLAASYYRSKTGSSAPVVLLVHESGRSRKDFEDPVLELKGQGLAEHLQGLNYAVLSLDLRGQGQNPRRSLARDERLRVVEDLAAAWAFQPGAAITTEGRPSDLSALVLISPMPEGSGYVLGHVLASLAPRIPLLLQAGERDNASKDAVQSVRKNVERARLNKVELYPSSLHGYKLLRLEPKVTASLLRFLETTLRGRAVDWEPQYNLMPVTFSEIQTVRNARTAETPKDQAKAQEAAQPKAEDAKDRPAEPAKPRRVPQQPPPRDRPRNPG